MCTIGMFADPQERDGEGALFGMDNGLKFGIEVKLERHMMIIKSLQLSKVKTSRHNIPLNIQPLILREMNDS